MFSSFGSPPRNVSNLPQSEEEKILLLVAENTELRSTLQQNNTYLKQLSSNLAEWQEEVLKVQKAYHDKIEKAGEIIYKLKEENTSLKQSIAVNTINGLSTPETSQEGPLESLDEYVFVASSINNESKAAGPQLPSVETEIDHQTDREDVVLITNQLAKEIEEHQNKKMLLEQSRSQLEKLTTEYQELSKKLALADRMLGERDTRSEQELGDLRQINFQLQNRCGELEEQVTTIGSRLAVAEEMVLSKQVDMAELQAEIAQLERSLETLPILKAQLDLFRADFEAEREQRQTLAGEKDELEREVRLLKRQLDDRSMESSYISVSSSGQRRSSSQPAADPVVNPTITSSSQVESYDCPKCNFKFQSNEALNNHLDICLNQHMFP